LRFHFPPDAREDLVDVEVELAAELLTP